MSSLLVTAARDLSRREFLPVVVATGLIFEELKKNCNVYKLLDVLESTKGGIWGDEAGIGKGYPVLRSTNMRSAKVDFTDVAWREIPPSQVDNFALRPGDILVTKSSGSYDLVGKCSLFTNPPDGSKYLFSNFVLRLRPKMDKIIPEFLAWFLRSPQALAWRYGSQTNAVGLRNLKTNNFLIQQISLPDPKVQKEIVVYLDSLENNRLANLPPKMEWISARISKIKRATSLIEEAMSLCLLSLQQSANYWNSILRKCFQHEKWSRVQLTDICTIIDNHHSTPKYQGKDFPCIRSQDISWGEIHYQDALMTSKQEFLDRTKRGEPIKGDILYVREGDIGRCALVDGSHRFSLGQRVMLIRPDTSRIIPKFLFYHLWSPAVLDDQVRAAKTGMTAHHINIKDFKKLHLRVPATHIQQKVISRLDTLLEGISTLERIQDQSPVEFQQLRIALIHGAFKS